MENETTVQDLISLSYEQKPIDFEQAFSSLITDRLANAVELRKTEIAQSLFNGAAVEDDVEIETDNEAEPDDLNFDETEFDNTPEETEDGETA